MYDILFTGRISPDTTINDVSKKLKEVFNVDDQYVSKMFATAPVVIRRCDDIHQARLYLEALDRTGAVCEIKVPNEDSQNHNPTESRFNAFGENAPNMEEVIETRSEKPSPDHSHERSSADGKMDLTGSLRAQSKDMTPCPFCGEEILAVAIKCKHCGSNLNNARAAITTGMDVGLLLVATPAIATLLIWFWIAGLNLLQSPGEKLSILVTATVVITALLVTMEASALGMNSDRGKGSYSPLVWFFLMLLIWFIAYPAYLAKRRTYGRSNLLGPGIVVVLLFIVSTGWIGYAIDKRNQEIRTQLEKSQRELERSQQELERYLQNLRTQ